MLSTSMKPFTIESPPSSGRPARHLRPAPQEGVDLNALYRDAERWTPSSQTVPHNAYYPNAFFAPGADGSVDLDVTAHEVGHAIYEPGRLEIDPFQQFADSLERERLDDVFYRALAGDKEALQQLSSAQEWNLAH